MGDVCQLRDGFEFYQDESFYEEVDAAGADVLAIVQDIHFLFADGFEVIVAEFDVKGSLVDDFLEAVTEGAMDFHGAADDALGNMFV